MGQLESASLIFDCRKVCKDWGKTSGNTVPCNSWQNWNFSFHPRFTSAL